MIGTKPSLNKISNLGIASAPIFLCIVFIFSYYPVTVNANGFSCDSGNLSETCTVSSLKNLDINEVITGSGNLVIGSGGNLRVATTSSFSIDMGGDVTIQSGGKITGNISNLTATNLTVDLGGLIDVSSTGYIGVAGSAGNTCSECSGGGRYGVISSYSYGGGGAYGGNGSPSISSQTTLVSNGGNTYGSITAPTDFGSAGGSGSTYLGGNGGGIFKANISGTLTNNGQILSNGGSGRGASFSQLGGGGSGGSIWITTGTLSGTGTTTANGGAGHVYNINGYGGGGGGGRIALYYTTDNSNQFITANGGGTSATSQKTFAGAGTIYRKQASWANGDLTVDNNGKGTIEYSTTPLVANLTLGTTTVRNSANLSFATTTSITLNAGDVYLNSGSITLPTSQSIFSGQALSVHGASTLNVIATTTNIPTFTDVTVLSGATLSHATSTYALIFNANNLNINSGGLVDVSFKGYANSIATSSGTSCVGCSGGGRYGVIGSNSYGGGGAYGGNGSPSIYNQTTPASNGGNTYGSVTAPIDHGSSGGGGGNSAYLGGSGGGVFKANISGTLTNNGQILSNGQNGYGSTYTYLPGAGSGGSIWITAGTLSGTGTTTANGGAGHVYNINGYGGGGGGGRIALYYTTDNSNQFITANGGGTSATSQKTFAGAGTIYRKQASWANGDLTVDNNGKGTIEYSTTPLVANLTLGTTTVRNSANLSFATTTSITLNAGDVYLNSGSITLPTVQSIFRGQRLFVLSTTSILNVISTTTNPATFVDVNILSGGLLSHSTSSYSIYFNTNNLTINSGGSISTKSKGYDGGTSTPGLSCDGCGGGGGYISKTGAGGGYGGNGANGKYGSSFSTGGGSYGLSSEPINFGSGGGGGSTETYNGGNGGGIIRINVSGTLTNYGSINSDGGNGNGSSWPYLGGGGSGGSIWMHANELSCSSGSISANGGNGYYRDSTYFGGGGSGGRIYFTYTSGTPCSILTASGGTASGIYGLAEDGSVLSTTAPTVTSSSTVSSITSTSVILNGSITNTGGSNATVRGFNYGLTLSYGSTTSESGSYGIADYSLPIADLVCNTTYHFRSYATNVAGTGYGSDQSFTTTACTPSLTTDSATAVTSSEASLNGTVTVTGGSFITTRGFHYGLTTAYGATTTETGSFGAVSFSSSTSSLTPNTTYHFRAYATNSAGTTYGNDQQFVTSLNTPTVSTNAASDIYTVGAKLNGTVGDTGGSNITVRGFYYGLTTDYGATTTETGSYNEEDFSSAIIGLTCNTAYHVKAYATNSSITGYGTDVTFTTEACVADIQAVVSTHTPSAQSTSATRRVQNLLNIGLIAEAERVAKEYGINISVRKNSSSSTTKMYFTSDSGILLVMGDKHADIARLQVYLNSHGYIIANSGPGSRGKETNLLGALTKRTLIKFQQKNKIPATGNFGPITREFINRNQ